MVALTVKVLPANITRDARQTPRQSGPRPIYQRASARAEWQKKGEDTHLQLGYPSRPPEVNGPVTERDDSMKEVCIKAHDVGHEAKGTIECLTA